MTASGWAAQLGRGLDPELVEAIVTCAVAPWATPERVGALLGRRLSRNASTDVADVVAELARPPDQAAAVRGGDVERAADGLLACDAAVLAVGRPGYPPQLAQTWPELGAPPWLFVHGQRRLPDLPAVAVVGTRHPTLDGLRTARALGRFLAEAGVQVVSGMARGIDQAAHAGALDGGGPTTAVLGTGFGVDYPAGDHRVRAAISASGGLVTEYPPGVPPRPYQFLERNRIISGLSAAVVVVEGKARSGALQTARLAAAQGREVLAAPGSLNAPTSRGPLALIRDGAAVLTRFDDVLETLAIAPVADGQRAPPNQNHSGLSAAAGAVHELLGPEPATGGALAAAAGLPAAEALAALADLEGRGLARYTGRGFVSSDLAR